MTDGPPNSQTKIIRVAVGSSNPAKVRAVEQALRRALEARDTRCEAAQVQLDVQGFAVESGVPHQPFGDDETCQGAKNRSKAAYLEYRKATGNAPHFAIGMEGGLEWRAHSVSEEETKKDLYCMAWIGVWGRRVASTVDVFAASTVDVYFGDKKPVFGLAKTASFALPTRITELVEQGLELGDADDKVFKRVKSKHGSGTVGILTDGLIDRSHYYEHALVMALAPWIRPDLYPKGML